MLAAKLSLFLVDQQQNRNEPEGTGKCRCFWPRDKHFEHGRLAITLTGLAHWKWFVSIDAGLLEQRDTKGATFA
jgi:hypothetical protein